MPKNYRSGSLAAVTVRLATSSYSPAKQERPSMTKAFSCTQQCHWLVPRLVGVPQGTDASAHYSLVRIFPTSSSKSGAHMQREAQATLSRAHFSDLIFMWPDHSMRNAFLENRALATGSCAFCPQFFQNIGRLKNCENADPPLETPGANIACKDTMIWALPFSTRIYALSPGLLLWSAACTYQLLFYLRGWHDDVKTDHWHSSVTRKFAD